MERVVEEISRGGERGKERRGRREENQEIEILIQGKITFLTIPGAAKKKRESCLIDNISETIQPNQIKFYI